MKRNKLSWRSRVLMGIGVAAVTVTSFGTTPAGADFSSCGAIVQAYIARYGGTQIGADEVSFQSGAVVMDLGCAETVAAVTNATGSASKTVNGCTDGWFCFYEHINWNRNQAGRRLQFRDCSSRGVAQSLTTYGFEDQTSSWENRKNAWVHVFNNGYSYGTRESLWSEDPWAHSSWVGYGNNDRADAFICIN